MIPLWFIVGVAVGVTLGKVWWVTTEDPTDSAVMREQIHDLKNDFHAARLRLRVYERKEP